MTNSPSKLIGGNFDDFLAEEGMLEEVTATALERISAHNSPHPGETLRDDVLPALALTADAAAAHLRMAPADLAEVLEGRARITPAIAENIEQWLGVERGGRASLWLALQAKYDAWQARAAG